MKRSAEKYKGTKGTWDIVGGRIDPGTKLIENLTREIFEETRLKLVSEPRLIHAQDIIPNAEKHVVRLTYVADIDGDGDPDAVLASQTGTIDWSANDGAGNFGPLQSIGVNNNPRISLADVNGDGRPDVIVASADQGSVGWYGNVGNGQVWEPHLISNTAVDVWHASAGDVDGDGWGDLGVSSIKWTGYSAEYSRVYVYRGGPALDGVADLLIEDTVDPFFFGTQLLGRRRQLQAVEPGQLFIPVIDRAPPPDPRSVITTPIGT